MRGVKFAPLNASHITMFTNCLNNTNSKTQIMLLKQPYVAK